MLHCAVCVVCALDRETEQGQIPRLPAGRWGRAPGLAFGQRVGTEHFIGSGAAG